MQSVLSDPRGVAEDSLHFEAPLGGFEVFSPAVHHAARAVNLLLIKQFLAWRVVGVVERQLKAEGFLQGLTPRNITSFTNTMRTSICESSMQLPQASIRHREGDIEGFSYFVMHWLETNSEECRCGSSWISILTALISSECQETFSFAAPLWRQLLISASST